MIFDPVVGYIVQLVKQQVQEVQSKGDTVTVNGFKSRCHDFTANIVYIY